MYNLIIFDIDESEFDKLRQFGIAESQAVSWHVKNRTNEGIIELFRQTKLIENNEVIINNRTLVDEENSENIDELFGKYLIAAFSDEKVDPHASSQNIIIINLMPFHITTTIVDKIAFGLINCSKSKNYNKDYPIVFLTRNIDLFSKSNNFSEIIRTGVFSNRFVIIDIRGFTIDYASEGLGKKERDIIPTSLFYKILKGSNLYQSLIYGTNTYLGHFELKNSHIRTHYDLHQFVRRDNVIEYIDSKFNEIILTFPKIIIFGIGLEESALNYIGYQLWSRNEDKVIGFETLFGDAFDSSNFTTLSKKCDCFVLLTDIVNTGGTLKRQVEAMRTHVGADFPIKLFTIVRMYNSPLLIEDNYNVIDALTIRRKFYPKNPDLCPLCQLQQPLKKVNKVKDFYHIDDSQPTPLDFWEVAQDSNALIIEEPDSQGRQFLYRIETITIAGKYRYWLKNIIRKKVKDAWPKYKPNTIFTIEEEPPGLSPGLFFAKVVAEALDITNIVSRKRSALGTATPVGLAIGDTPFSSKAGQILVVDDGINNGFTMKALIAYCRGAGFDPVGAIVLDSRLTPQQLSNLEKMIDCRIISLYTWQSPPL